MDRLKGSKRIIAWVLAMICAVCHVLDFTLLSSAGQDGSEQSIRVCRIRNSFSNHEFPDNIFLYEEDGKVYYGTPESETDLKYYWVIETDGNGTSKIRNVATGNYMSYVDQEHYNEAMGCAPISEETNNSFIITDIQDGEVVKHNIIASTNSNLVVHYQQQLGHAQCSNWAQAGWGTAQWLFISSAPQTQQEGPGEPQEPEEPAELTGGLVIKIKNSYVENAWLYEKDGRVYYGKPDSVFDLSYYWVIENDVDGQGNSRIRNAATGHYMNYADQEHYNDPITCVDIENTANVLFDVNHLGDSVYNIIADTNPNLVVHIQQQYGHAQCSNWAQADWGSAKWIFEDAADKTPQGLAFKIENSYTRTTSGDATSAAMFSETATSS